MEIDDNSLQNIIYFINVCYFSSDLCKNRTNIFLREP